MRLLDVNVLVAAHRAEHEHHAPARAYLDMLAADLEPFAVTDLVAGSFVRLVTNRRVFRAPSSIDEAADFLTELRARPGHHHLAPGPRHVEILLRLCRESDATGDLVPDAQLAAIAIENAAEVVSFDRDFARFESVRWSRPA